VFDECGKLEFLRGVGLVSWLPINAKVFAQASSGKYLNFVLLSK